MNAKKAEPEAPPRLIRIGDLDLRFGTFACQVVAVASPGDPKTRVDLLYEEAGKRRIASGVERGLGPGLWHLPEDAEAVRVRTPRELVRESQLRGEVVPEVGLIITYAYNKKQGLGLIEIEPTRARVIAVSSLTVVDLEVLHPQPPVDLEAADRVRGIEHGVRLVEVANDYDRTRRYCGMWEYAGVGTGLIKPFGPIDTFELFPPCVCSRCSKPCRATTEILPEPARVETMVDIMMGTTHTAKSAGNLCPACVTALRGWLAPISPATATA